MVTLLPIEGEAFYGCIGELIINSKTFVEKDYTFHNCPQKDSYGWLNGNKFTQLIIGNSITKIGDYTFFGCSSLTSVIIPDSVTSIGEGAFSGCESLTSVTIPDSVTSIESGAFSGCNSLTSVTIPDSVTSIAEGAFYECSSLKTIICKASTPPVLEKDAFYKIPVDATIIIPEGCEDAYMNSDWKYLFEE